MFDLLTETQNKEKNISSTASSRKEKKTPATDTSLSKEQRRDINRFIKEKYNRNDVRKITLEHVKYTIEMKEDYDGIKFPDHHQEYDRILVSLTSKDCPFKKSEHSSNHNFILIDSFFGSRLKCHDNEEPCKSATEKIIKPEYLPEYIKNIIGGKSVDESSNDIGSTNASKIEETTKAIVKIPFKSDFTQPLLSDMKLDMGAGTQDLPNGYVASLPLNTY